MNKLILLTSVAIMTLGIASESWAVTSGCDCGSTANGGSASDCCWKIENGVLTIYPNPERSSTGNVTMKDFSETKAGRDTANGYPSPWASTAPWARQGATSVVIENGISNIGKLAFDRDTKITGVTGMENVTSIGNSAFYGAASLKSVDMPNVTSIGREAFYNASSLSYAGLNQDGSVSIGSNAFDYTNISTCTGTEAYCGSCPDGQSVMPGRGCVANAQTEPQGQQGQGGSQASEQQGSQVSGQATSAADCAASGKYWQEGKCVSSCGASFKLNDGWCDRQRYTPAEATAVLTNDNNNSVIITFKK